MSGLKARELGESCLLSDEDKQVLANEPRWIIGYCD